MPRLPSVEVPSLERSWLFARLAVPAGGCPDARTAELVGTVVAGLVAAARRADPGSGWFYDRLGPTGVPVAPAGFAAGPRLRLGICATEAGLDAIRAGLRAYDRGFSLVDEAHAVRDPARGGPLAQAGSDLALALLAGDGPWLPGAELPLAVAHLRHLAGLLPAADRAAFLFLHWQDRGAALTGAHRRELAAQAAAGADKIVLAAGDLPPGGAAGAAWRRYLDRVADVAGRDHPDAPRGFLLAHHAQLSHDRWGIAPDVDALAALALRLTLVRRAPESKERAAACR